MKAYNEKYSSVLKYFSSSEKGLENSQIAKNRQNYGKNQITKQKGKSFIKRILEALSDPMLIILEIAMVITLGVNIGKSLKGLNGDYYECLGIVIAIVISVTLTLVMEGKSQKAFEMLNKLYSSALIKVRRNGEVMLVKQEEIVCGDIVLLSSGDKIVADGRLISSSNLSVDESSLTGETIPVSKDSERVFASQTPLADRINMVYSGTFVSTGSGEMVVTAVGDSAEIGVIASELQVKNSISAPLQEKLDRLGKLVTALGAIASVFVLILTVAKLYATNNVTFDSVENAFLSSIILIVASVPEGLPTTVAIALTLNVVKLSSSNALIRKLVATETVGCVSVICSDKTGTLTENKMKVVKIVSSSGKLTEDIVNNIAINSSAELSIKNGEVEYIGSVTECALLYHLKDNNYNYSSIRENSKILSVVPFSSTNKYMQTDLENVSYIKGATEVILGFLDISTSEKEEVLRQIAVYENKGMRVIAFAHKKSHNSYIFDGFAVVNDNVRKDVFKAVKECKKAGIKVKILTGDSSKTAYNIAKQLAVCDSENNVYESSQIDRLNDDELIKLLPNILVVARCSPKTKLRIVQLLKQAGEVVACTGDGINDAPAIKHADIGISMGAGSEITKEASDIILLDNSFSTIVKAISFGRNIYANFQRFIMFQLSVNLTAVIFIVASIICGLGNPFNTIELLWINIIMDGPPALTLGLESHSNNLMNLKPVKRSDNIVSKNMLIRIFVHAFITTFALLGQYKYNYIGCGESQMKTVLFCLFILFQLFNAFNCRELGATSVFSNLKQNKLMLIVFFVTFVLQVVIVEVLGGLFKTQSLEFIIWLKVIGVAFSIIVISELYKFLYRSIKNGEKLQKNICKRLIKKKNNA